MTRAAMHELIEEAERLCAQLRLRVNEPKTKTLGALPQRLSDVALAIQLLGKHV